MVIDVAANDTDPDGDTLRSAVRRAPLHGTVRIQPDRTLRYTPSRDFNGAEVFTYAASDGSLSDEAVVIVSVSAVNDRPDFPSVRVRRSVADATQPGSVVGRAVKATDVDGDQLAYRLLDVDAPLFSIDYHTGEITVGPETVVDRSAQSSYRLRVQAADPSGARASSYVDIAVTARGSVSVVPTAPPGGSVPIDIPFVPTLRDAFVDDDGTYAQEAINKIAEAGITAGCNAERTRFCPYEPVTRAQMALFLARALKL